MAELDADLVLEGGGVKGIALAGAYSVLEERGYTVRRVAGTSAGSIVGALIAAGMSAAELEDEMRRVDYAAFQDESALDKVPLLGKAISLLLEQGLFEGRFAREWIAGLLARKGVRTFADLAYDDAEHPLPAERRFRLVVMASDVTRGRLRRLPWEYDRYGCPPGEQPVADAVRASMSIPFFFEPVRLKDRETGTDSTIVDGGMLSNFPVDVFDAQGRTPRWPTFGIKLSARPGDEREAPDTKGTLGLTLAMIRTLTGFYDQMHIDDPAVQARTIFVDTGGVKGTDFHLGDAERDMLFEKGRRAATRFFDGGDGQAAWDWQAYLDTYRRPEGQPLGSAPQ